MDGSLGGLSLSWLMPLHRGTKPLNCASACPPRRPVQAHPYSVLPTQHAEEELQLLHCDAVAGQHAQHVHQQICATGKEKQTVRREIGKNPNEETQGTPDQQQINCYYVHMRQDMWRQVSFRKYTKYSHLFYGKKPPVIRVPEYISTCTALSNVYILWMLSNCSVCPLLMDKVI